LFGRVYGNRPALEVALADARARDAEAVYFLGDVGGFGPHPDAAAKLLRDARVTCIQGNYDAAIATGADDCGCGYSDPRDIRFAHIAYVYTLSHSRSEEHTSELQSLTNLVCRLLLEKKKKTDYTLQAPSHLLELLNRSLLS